MSEDTLSNQPTSLVEGVPWDQLQTIDVGAATHHSTRLQPGMCLGDRYIVEDLLGEGGMGEVWLVQDRLEQRRVALKRIRWAGPTNFDELERAASRARLEFFAMKRLKHPGTVEVYDCGFLSSGDRYFTMEVVSGQDLGDLVAPGERLGEERALEIIIEVVEILAFIHSRLFVHCDIKPRNIRITDEGSVKLLDFGIMHQLGTPGSLHVFGTPAFMAPELIRAGIIDGRTDLYAVGVLAFQLLTGRSPFEENTVEKLLRAHQTQPPPRPTSIAPVRPELEAIIMRLLEKEPKARFADAADLLGALARASGKTLETEPLSARASYLHVAEVVGRDTELGELRARLAATEHNQSRALFIGAPAGVGKSRLLHELELIASLSDVPFFLGECRQESAAPLRPIRLALRKLAATGSGISTSVGSELLHNFLETDARGEEVRVEGVQQKAALFEALDVWLTSIRATTRLILAFEDLHWADSATLELLNVIIRILDGTRIMIVASYRTDELDRLSPAFRTVDEGLADIILLQPLTGAGTRRLVELVLEGVKIPDELIDGLQRVTGGNSFFVMETLRGLVENGSLQRRGGRWQIQDTLAQRPLPSTIGDAVRERLATLSPERLDFFRRVAAAERTLDLRLITSLVDLPEEELYRALDEGVERQFLTRAQGTYIFSHDTVRGAIYDDTPTELRYEYHGRIATALASRPNAQNHDAQRIGYHFARSGVPRRAIPYLLRAGERAVSQHALLEATKGYSQAADILENNPDYENRDVLLTSTWATLVELGYSSDPQLCIAYAERLFGRWSASGMTEAGASGWRESLQRATTSDAPERSRILTDLYTEHPITAESSAKELCVRQAQYKLYYGMIVAIMGRREATRKVIEEMARTQPEESPYRALSVAAQACLACHDGTYAEIAAEMKDNIKRVLVLCGELSPVPKPLAWAVSYAVYIYNVTRTLMGWPADELLSSAAAAIARDHDLVEIHLYIHLRRVFRAAMIGHRREFDTLLAEGNDLIRRQGNQLLPQRNVAIFTTPYYLERRELSSSTALIARIGRLCELLPNDRWMKLYYMVHGACLRVLVDDWDGAAEAIPVACRAAREAQFRHLTMLLTYHSRLERRLGNRQAAVRIAREALDRALDPRIENPFDEILARRAVAEAEGGNEAIEQFEIALQVAQESGNLLQQGIVLDTHAEIIERRDPARAMALLDEATPILEEVDAPYWRERAAALRTRLLNR